MEHVEFNGWKNNARLTNGDIDLIVSADIGPRVLRFGFNGQRNVFAEIEGQQGGIDECEWMIRGGHRFWAAPEEKPQTYELDNAPIEIEETADGLVTRQPTGPLSGMSKMMAISLSPLKNEVKIVHTLTNTNDSPVDAAPWALTVLARDGKAVIPLPEKAGHSDKLTHNQEWSLWGYTDLSDSRWTIGSRYIFFEQDRRKGANKIGIAHREGWAGYLLDNFLFVKKFERFEGRTYPDGGVNFETFSNEDFLELESLGPLESIAPGKSVTHEERWMLFKDIPSCESESDVDSNILPLLR